MMNTDKSADNRYQEEKRIPNGNLRLGRCSEWRLPEDHLPALELPRYRRQILATRQLFASRHRTALLLHDRGTSTFIGEPALNIAPRWV